jgi:hypothetical protein
MQEYRNKFAQNPDNINNYIEFIKYLNDHKDLLIKLEIFDFTENKINLENLPNFNQKEYRHYLKTFKAF